jgi:hypothetical protein
MSKMCNLSAIFHSQFYATASPSLTVRPLPLNCKIFYIRRHTFSRILTRVLMKERSLPGENVMENRETQFTTNDLGLLVFVLVAGWLLLFQSGLFR